MTYTYNLNMKHQVIHTENAPKAIGPYSQAVNPKEI